ncbi:MAG TPA: hypothetical protein VK369_06980 [Segetibacter sp.]|nr:hypothetical protein [Segetibacter sp.]
MSGINIKLFYFIACLNWNCILAAQNIPIKEVYRVNTFKEADSLFRKLDFHYAGTDSSLGIDYYFDKIISSDTVRFVININDSTGVTTKAYFMKAPSYENFKRQFKANGYTRLWRMGNKYSSMEAYQTKGGKDLTVAKTDNLYIIYFDRKSGRN